MSRPSAPADDAPEPGLSVETVLQSVPDAVLVSHAETGTIVRANEAAGALFGCQSADLVGIDQLDLHPAEDAEQYSEAFSRARESQQVERLADGSPLYIETRSGERKPVEINTRRFESGGETYVLGVFREVEDRLERERELERTSERLEALLDATPLPVAVLDATGTVEIWNRAAEETFGYAPEEVTGDPYPLFVDDDEFPELLERVLDDGLLDGYETVHRAKDGSRKSVELFVRPLYEDGTVTGVVGASIDVTDRRRRAQTLDVLYRVLRHNLRNQLTIIRGLAETIVTDAVGGSETAHDRAAGIDVAAAADKIVSSADDLVALSERANEIQTLVRAARNRTEHVSLDGLLSSLEVTDLRDLTVSTESASGTTDSVATVAVPGQAEPALSRLLDVAVDDDAATALDVRVRRRYVRVRVESDEPTLSESERRVIETGRETPLRHEDGLDLAQIYLVLTAVGGALFSPDGGTVVVEIPRIDAEDAGAFE
jgi:PAS domain S-box-containing protein